MGVLVNQKHEAFAQLIAGGSTIVDAYEKSGYLRNRSNACRLRLHERITARIDELVAQKTAAVSLAQLSAAERAGVDQYWVLRNLRINAVQSMRHGDRAAAARSLELVGRHLNMFVDRKVVEINMVDDADEYLQRIMAIVDGRVIEAEPVQLVEQQQLGKDGHEYGSDEEA